jgi:hypothetical protein
MGLSEYKVAAAVTVSDMDRAREFYEGKLGLLVGIDSGDNLQYRCGEGSVIHVYLSPEHAGKATATLAGWGVNDIEEVVDELTSKGVAFDATTKGPSSRMREESPHSRAVPRSPTSRIRTATLSRSLKRLVSERGQIPPGFARPLIHELPRGSPLGN